jgi:hypothetical protein
MSTQIIKLNRGDSYEFTIIVPSKEDSSINYILEETKDVVYFALMFPNQRFEDALLLHGYTLEDQDEETGKITIKLSPNDTRSLAPGVYYYTIKLQRGGSINFINDMDEPDEVRTIVERTKFILNE